jgi:uncharacterized protein (DUF1501 family)
MSHSRRDFLVRTTCAALGASAIQGTIRQFGLANLLATPNAITGSYRALVCVLLNGGSDSNNMVIPTDATNYNAYAAARPGLNIPLVSLLPINNPASTPGQTFGFHPNFGDYYYSGNPGPFYPGPQGLFNSGKLAVVTNVGPLVTTLTQAEYMANSKPKPYALFSHSDQVQAWQSGRADIKVSTGWGGRSADAVATCNAGGGGFPTITSIAGSSTFCIGLKRPLSIGTGSLTSALVLNGFSGSDLPRRNSMDYLRTIDQTATMIAAASATTQQAIDIGADFSQDPTINTVFPNTSIANQLKQVAKVIKLVQGAPAGLTLSRQIFFVSQGGYDTHQNQLTDQGNNFLDLAQALASFYQATVELGLQDKITTFTHSDFGRTLQPSGAGGSIGSDHGWGSHQLVIGDAVGGGNFYGTPGTTGLIFPVLQPGGPDDTTNSGSSGRGRWIPTSASDQYGATLARWFGVADPDMGGVFPNIGNFAPDLGFMGPAPGSC